MRIATIINILGLLLSFGWCIKSNWDFEPLIVTLGLIVAMFFHNYTGNKLKIRGNINKIIQKRKKGNNDADLDGNGNVVKQED